MLASGSLGCLCPFPSCEGGKGMSWPLLSSPAMSCQGEWGPLWAVPVGKAFRLSVRLAVASLSSPLWLLGAEGPRVQAVTSSHAVLLFRGVLREMLCLPLGLPSDFVTF